MATEAADAHSDELAEFGYKQELDRSIGKFASFAAGISYISILTGVSSSSSSASRSADRPTGGPGRWSSWAS